MKRDDGTEDTPVPKTPVTKRSTGSFAVAEQNAHWCRVLAAACRVKARDLPPLLGRRDLVERAALEGVAARADALMGQFERWTAGAVVDGQMVPIRKDDTDRMADLAAYGALVSDAAKLGVKPF